MPVTKEKMKAFGARLKEARENSGLSTKELAKILKKDPGTLRNYETGNYLPSIKTLIEIIEVLKVNPDYILAPLVEMDIDDELNKIIEKVKRIYKSEGDREAIKTLINRYRLPEEDVNV